MLKKNRGFGSVGRPLGSAENEIFKEIWFSSACYRKGNGKEADVNATLSMLSKLKYESMCQIFN